MPVDLRPQRVGRRPGRAVARRWAKARRAGLEDLPAGERGSARSLFDLTEPGPDRARRLLASFRALAA